MSDGDVRVLARWMASIAVHRALLNSMLRGEMSGLSGHDFARLDDALDKIAAELLRDSEHGYKMWEATS